MMSSRIKMVNRLGAATAFKETVVPQMELVWSFNFLFTRLKHEHAKGSGIHISTGTHDKIDIYRTRSYSFFSFKLMSNQNLIEFNDIKAIWLLFDTVIVI